MSVQQDDYALPKIELMRIVSLREAAKLRGVSVRTLRRTDPERIIQVSERRQGMRIGDALQLRQPAA